MGNRLNSSRDHYSSPGSKAFSTEFAKVLVYEFARLCFCEVANLQESPFFSKLLRSTGQWSSLFSAANWGEHSRQTTGFGASVDAVVDLCLVCNLILGVHGLGKFRMVHVNPS